MMRKIDILFISNHANFYEKFPYLHYNDFSVNTFHIGHKQYARRICYV